MVIPVAASSRMTSSTSLIISGSSADVGSSKSMISGCMANDLAMATRCCCPPDSSAGYFLACSGIPTLSSSCIACSSASAFGMCRTLCGANVMLLMTVMCGNRLNCWNTIPTSRRMVSRFRRSLVISMPSMTILPFWCSSSRFNILMNVDFPDPEGPHITSTSPLLTFMDMSCMAQKFPNHLNTFSQIMMSSRCSIGTDRMSALSIAVVSVFACVLVSLLLVVVMSLISPCLFRGECVKYECFLSVSYA